MDEEVPYPLEFKQEERFKFATTCDGFVNCVSSQVLNPSTPTIGLYFGLGLVLFIAIYRKGAQSASGTAVWEEELEEIDSEEDEIDPWADLVEDEKIEQPSQTSVLNEPEIQTQEFTESIVEDTDVVPNHVEEPSISASDLLAPVEQEQTSSEPEPKPEVDLAKAALDAASKMIPDSYVAASSDSGAMSNSSVEWYNKALFLMEDKKYSEALSCFDKALVGAAEDEDLAIRVLNGRGHAFYYMEEYPEAIKAYFEAMRINKDKVTGATLYNMGTAYAFVELYDDAIKCFKQAMPRGLEDDQKKMCKEQIKRCNELQKIQKRKLSR